MPANCDGVEGVACEVTGRAGPSEPHDEQGPARPNQPSKLSESSLLVEVVEHAHCAHDIEGAFSELDVAECTDEVLDVIVV